MVPRAHPLAGLVPALVLAALLGLSCAGQGFPPGGPADTTPPTVLRTSPDTNAVRVETDEIVLEFGEYVDRRSVEESIFISPHVGKFTADWSGTEVALRLTEPLRARTTYVVSVGTDVVDIHGNRMASGFTLAFSTGDSIDRGFVSGRVFDEKPEGVMVFAYRTDGIPPDSLNPAVREPDYITQSGKGGMFTLANLAPGVYRVMAVRDEFRNLLYDRQVDAYGCATADVVLDEAHMRVADVWFRLALEDTVGPFLSGVSVPDRTHLRARFGEPLDSTTIVPASFAVLDTLSGDAVPVADAFFPRGQPAQAGLVLGAPLAAGRGYLLRAPGVRDRRGNRPDSAGAVAPFTGSGEADTLKPGVAVVGISDSVRGVPLAGTMELAFTEAVRREGMAAAVSLVKDGGQPLALRLRWAGGATAVFSTPGELSPASWYTLTVRVDSIVDHDGNRWRDSVLSLRFQTLDLRMTGTMEGVVSDVHPADVAGPIRLSVRSIDLPEAHVRELVLQRPGTFTLERLPEGRYLLAAFRDRDSSGAFDAGQPFPFAPAERFVEVPDTLKIRARWGIEGVPVRLR